jgi:hypothetical protein
MKQERRGGLLRGNVSNRLCGFARCKDDVTKPRIVPFMTSLSMCLEPHADDLSDRDDRWDRVPLSTIRPSVLPQEHSHLGRSSLLESHARFLIIAHNGAGPTKSNI